MVVHCVFASTVDRPVRGRTVLFQLALLCTSGCTSPPLDPAPLDPETGEHQSAVVTGQTYPEHPALIWDVSLIQTFPALSEAIE